MKRFILVLALLATAGTLVVGQRLSIDTTYIRSGASIGGAVLYAPSYATDQFFYFPPTGGMLLTTSNYGGWSLSGNALGGTEVLGSINGFDVHLIAGGATNTRMSLLNNTPAVLLPARTELRRGDVAGGEYSALKAPQIQTGNVTYVLPYSKPLVVGQRLVVDSINVDTVVLGYTTEEKSTDVSFDLIGTEQTTNSEVPVLVTGMSIAVEPYKTYAFEAVISLCAVTGNPKVGISFDIPDGAAMHYCHFDLTSTNGATECDLTNAQHNYQVVPCSNDPDVHDEHYLLKGFIVTFANGGTVDMYFNTENSNNAVTISRESYMQVTTN
ncbi:MAG: hypothetical protein EHM43_01395 [Ignavibacteriae bacterium]|nr:MAG: hypothetical protein EHM43_01395 [Ignavibacteriota bacterium]